MLRSTTAAAAAYTCNSVLLLLVPRAIQHACHTTERLHSASCSVQLFCTTIEMHASTIICILCSIPSAHIIYTIHTIVAGSEDHSITRFKTPDDRRARARVRASRPSPHLRQHRERHRRTGGAGEHGAHPAHRVVTTRRRLCADAVAFCLAIPLATRYVPCSVPLPSMRSTAQTLTRTPISQWCGLSRSCVDVVLMSMRAVCLSVWRSNAWTESPSCLRESRDGLVMVVVMVLAVAVWLCTMRLLCGSVMLMNRCTVYDIPTFILYVYRA